MSKDAAPIYPRDFLSFPGMGAYLMKRALNYGLTIVLYWVHKDSALGAHIRGP